MSKNLDENENVVKEKIANEWLIRPQNIYEEEYQECTSFRGRFNQYFVFGHTIDCTQWKRDADNCARWKENGDVKAARELIASEQVRRKARLQPHYANDVWTKRKTPPENWNRPLPDYIVKEYDTSFLNIKNKELKGEIPPTVDSQFSSCSIM